MQSNHSCRQIPVRSVRKEHGLTEARTALRSGCSRDLRWAGICGCDRPAGRVFRRGCAPACDPPMSIGTSSWCQLSFGQWPVNSCGLNVWSGCPKIVQKTDTGFSNPPRRTGRHAERPALLGYERRLGLEVWVSLSLVLEPARPAHCHIRAWRKSEDEHNTLGPSDLQTAAASLMIVSAMYSTMPSVRVLACCESTSTAR